MRNRSKRQSTIRPGTPALLLPDDFIPFIYPQPAQPEPEPQTDTAQDLRRYLTQTYQRTSGCN